MTDLPTPPHKIGDTLYYPTVDTTTAKHPCPDCLGTHVWKLTTPAGSEIEVSCHRCSTNFISNELPSLEYYQYVGRATPYTICSMSVSSANRFSSDTEDTRITYHNGPNNCGSVMYPHKLFDTEEEALAAAQSQAHFKNTALRDTPEMTIKKRMSQLHLPEAVSMTWNSARWEYYWVHMHFRREIQDMIDSEDPWKVEDIIEQLKWNMEYDFGRQRDWPDMLQSLHKSISLLHDVAGNMDDTTMRGEIYTFLDSIAPEHAKERPEMTSEEEST